MANLSEDKIASIVERVVARLENGDRRVPLREVAAEVSPSYGCGPARSSESAHSGEPARSSNPARSSEPARFSESGRFSQPGRTGDAARSSDETGARRSSGPAAAVAPQPANAARSRTLSGLASGRPRGNGRALRGVFADVDSAVESAREAFERLGAAGLAVRRRIIAEMRAEAHQHVDTISQMAVEETGLGRVDQKVIKNRLVIDKTPGCEVVEPTAFSGDDGLTIEEYAPWGVIGAITPTTNPTETIICNAIGMLAAGNSVVFNAHPKAKQVSAYTVDFLNAASVRAGGPENLVCCTEEPTIELAQRLMRHAGVRLLVVTGGPGVVAEAMGAGKKVIAAGPGNPPAVVDATADLSVAGEGIVKGVSLDNNIVCTAEKEIIAVSEIADALKVEMKRHGAYELTGDETRRLENLVLDDKGPNRAWVGQDARSILREIGVNAPADTLMAFAEVPEEHPFIQHELLMPVTGLARARDAREAIRMAVRAEQGNGHTACMYSKNIEHLHLMARAINTSIFTKNAPTYAGLGLGGEGYCSFTIASPTGEGLTTAEHFSRRRRCTLKDYFRIV